MNSIKSNLSDGESHAIQCLPFRLSVSVVLLVPLLWFRHWLPSAVEDGRLIYSLNRLHHDRFRLTIIPDYNFDTRHFALDLRLTWAREHVMVAKMIVLAPLLDNLAQIELDAANWLSLR